MLHTSVVNPGTGATKFYKMAVCTSNEPIHKWLSIKNYFVSIKISPKLKKKSSQMRLVGRIQKNFKFAAIFCIVSMSIATEKIATDVSIT